MLSPAAGVWFNCWPQWWSTDHSYGLSWSGSFSRPYSILLHYSSNIGWMNFYSSGPTCPIYTPYYLYLDVARHHSRRYVHRGSGRRFNIDNTKPITSFWSSSPRPPNKHRHVVDHGVLANTARAAGTTTGNSSVSVGLFNIRSLTNKAPLVYHLLQDNKRDFLHLTETWQRPKDFRQLNEAVPPGFVYTWVCLRLGLFTPGFVYTCQPRATGRGAVSQCSTKSSGEGLLSLSLPLTHLNPYSYQSVDLGPVSRLRWIQARTIILTMDLSMHR